jgi:hypothetical protein
MWRVLGVVSNATGLTGYDGSRLIINYGDSVSRHLDSKHFFSLTCVVTASVQHNHFAAFSMIIWSHHHLKIYGILLRILHNFFNFECCIRLSRQSVKMLHTVCLYQAARDWKWKFGQIFIIWARAKGEQVRSPNTWSDSHVSHWRDLVNERVRRNFSGIEWCSLTAFLNVDSSDWWQLSNLTKLS